MALVARKGVDECSGHDDCPPRKAVEGSPDVFLEGHAIVRVGDLWEPHGGPDHPDHDSAAEEGSDEIFINGKAVVRVGDCLDCGSVVKSGSMALFAGGKKTAKAARRTKRVDDDERLNKAERQNAVLKKMKPGRMPRASVEAPMDKARAQKLVALAKKLGEKYGIPPALALGLASRESGFGRHLRADGYGKYDPDGFGMFQVDKEFHRPKGGPYSLAHAEQAMSIWSDTLKQVKAAHPGWDREEQLAGAIAGYNFGPGNVRTRPSNAANWARLDDGSAGDDYSRDVWARAQYFANHLDWD
jgi:uncharacterized Zn-binding protein involved in type VI secretion